MKNYEQMLIATRKSNQKQWIFNPWHFYKFFKSSNLYIVITYLIIKTIHPMFNLFIILFTFLF
jgi:hypothetical protein